MPRVSLCGDSVVVGGYGAPGNGVEEVVEGRGVFSEAAEAGGRSGPEPEPGVGPRWDVDADVAGRDVFGGNIDDDPPVGCLKDSNPSDGLLPFWGGIGEGVVGLVWPGIRIAKPQRVQGPLLISHSLPQRGHNMLHPSLMSAWNNLQ